MQSFRYTNLIVAAGLFVFGAACAKKQVAVAPPPPAPVANNTPAPRETTPPPPRETPAQPVARSAPSSYPNAATRARIDELIARIQDAYFDYDQHTLRNDAIATLSADSKELAEILRNYPGYKLKIEGYCDERGSAEYNIALGDARAKAAKDYLVNAGVASAQLDTVSFGKEMPVCTDHEESCWQKNRRVHIIAEKQNS
ncbi:MAG TPA: OmpA family protein [Bryobacteraceae bacterium]|nr:OmpA family protein [Bryobacteraceae bacterium]